MPKRIDSPKPPKVAYPVNRLSRQSRGHSATSILATSQGAGMRYGGILKILITRSQRTNITTIRISGRASCDSRTRRGHRCTVDIDATPPDNVAGNAPTATGVRLNDLGLGRFV